MKNLLTGLAILAVFTLSFVLLGGWDRVGLDRMGVGLVSLGPLFLALYILNNIPQTRAFGLEVASFAVLFGLTIPLGGCMVSVAIAALLVFLIMAQSYVNGTITWLEHPAEPYNVLWPSLLGQFAAFATYAAWLVYRIF